MANSCFTFDLIINRICLEDERIKNVNELKIIAMFNNLAINVTSNSKSLNEFRSGGSCEFDAFPELLALEMKIFPLKMSLRYDDQTIGKTCMKWPDKIVEQIDENMEEIMHCAQCIIQDKTSNNIGTIDILVRLQVKSKYTSKKESSDKIEKLQALLNKGDTFYMLSDKNKDQTECPETSECSTSTPWSTPSVVTECNVRPKKSKNFDLEYCESCGKKDIIVPNLNKRSKHGSSECPCMGCASKSGLYACQTSADKIRENLDDNIFAKSPEAKPRLLDAGQIPKCCPACKEDLSWVPNYVPCPHCGYIPTKSDDPAYNADMNAKEILQLYAGTCKEELSSSDCRNMIEKKREEEMKVRRKKFTKRRPKRLKAGNDRRPRCNKITQQPVNSKVTAFIKNLLPPKKDKHLNCIHGQKKVPPNKGWMWDLMATGVNRKWKPGVIRKPIKEIMSWFLGSSFPGDSIPVSPYAGSKKLKVNKCKEKEEDIQPEHLEPRPTLYIHKKHDEYTVTMRPLKDKEGVTSCANPYLEMKPISFKITKNPVLVSKRKLKRKLKILGHIPCTCHLPISMCTCRGYKEKQLIMQCVENECVRENIPCCRDTFEFSDVTDSESEVDFAVTPPIGRIKPENCKKPDLAHIATQYDVKDWKLVPKFPISSALNRLKRSQRIDLNRPRAALFGCPQNVQPPIIIPKIEKPPKDDKKKKKGKKGKGKGKKKGKKGKK